MKARLMAKGETPREQSSRDSLMSELRSAFFDALMDGDAARADVIVGDAVRAQLDEGVIYDDVIAPVMRRIGTLWKEGQISVAEEHLATHISLRVLALQREAFRVARQRSSQRIMLAAVEGEHHVVGLAMVGNLLAHHGFDVRYLGADLPLESIPPIIRRHSPRVFGLSVTMPWRFEVVHLAVDEILSADPSVSVLIGGSGVPEHFRGSERVAVVRSASRVVDEVDTLLRRPSQN